MIDKMKVVEGSYAMAHAVKVCRPNVISAYPITPQTHIVEDLSQFMADGEIPDCEFITIESEFSALSALVGASSAGARTYSSTSSQGLELMHEVLFNVSGMRLPTVMTVVNRAVSAPINIWNDHQDSISQRDTGWIQLYGENIQEICDLMPMAYKVAEDKDVMLPAMVCMDGFILSHVFEPVILLEQEHTDEYLPPYNPEHILDVKNPKTFGSFADPSSYTEFRYMQQKGMDVALNKIEMAVDEFNSIFGRQYSGLIDTYMAEDAEILLMAMGSVIGTIKDVIDEARSDGIKVGLLKIRSFRPFPVEAVRSTVANASVIVILDKNISLGLNEGSLCTEVKSCLYNTDIDIPVIGFMLGHGGRDITKKTIGTIIEKGRRTVKSGIKTENEFIDLRGDLL